MLTLASSLPRGGTRARHQWRAALRPGAGGGAAAASRIGAGGADGAPSPSSARFFRGDTRGGFGSSFARRILPTPRRSGPPPPHGAPPHRHVQSRTRVFVSQHNSSLVSANHIHDFLKSRGVPPTSLRSSPTHVLVEECPFCSKPTGGKADNLYKLYVAIGSGAYFCHRCGAGGSWYDFKRRMGGVGGENEVTDAAGGVGRRGGGRRPWRGSVEGRALEAEEGWGGGARGSGGADCLPMPQRRLARVYISNLFNHRRPGTGSSPPGSGDEGGAGEGSDKADGEGEAGAGAGASVADGGDALSYLTKVRGLDTRTLWKYGVGLAHYNFPSRDPEATGSRWERDLCVTFPWVMRASEVAEQEALRGGRYEWEDEDGGEEEAGTKSGREGEGGGDDSVPPPPSPLRARDPWVTRRIKARALGDNKSRQRLDPPGGGWGLFGHHTVPPDASSVVLTEGEYDAMAVYQATGRPAVSLPNGCRSLPPEVLPLLERFETVYLWMDDDGPGREGAEMFAKKIGVKRCLIVTPSSSKQCSSKSRTPKDANDALLMGLDLEEMIQSAAVLPHDGILVFGDLREQVRQEIFHPDEYAGIKMPSLPSFTGIVKGFRRGEMTVLSGPTGSGKTTFLGQLSLDFAEQGANTLWGSFEIKNTRLIHKLLQQYSRRPLPLGRQDMIPAFEDLADRFESLPLYFMKFHGGSDIDDVIDAMDYAVYVHDVEQIILDNLQFMITRDAPPFGRPSTFDKFDMQDVAIEKFRKFATERNVHINLVCHPRKEEEGSKLALSSIYGSAKATQEADTVLILQVTRGEKFLEVKKNRFDGTLGSCALHFHRGSGRYTESPLAALGGTPPKVPSKPRGPPPDLPKPRIPSPEGDGRDGGAADRAGPKASAPPPGKWREIEDS